MPQTTRERVVNGIELPPVGTWEIDPAHTTVEFIGRHILTKTRGRFTDFSGEIRIGETPQESSVQVQIDARSIVTSVGQRDDHLRSDDFLDVEKYPNLTFKSTEFRLIGGTEFELDGQLSIKDDPRSVTLTGEFNGWSDDPFGNKVMSFSARTQIDREDWDMTWNMVIETGGLMVGKKVDIELEVEAKLKQEG
jgi:polyisoprenoid-binding protein YceI